MIVLVQARCLLPRLSAPGSRRRLNCRDRSRSAFDEFAVFEASRVRDEDEMGGLPDGAEPEANEQKCCHAAHERRTEGSSCWSVGRAGHPSGPGTA